MTRPEPKRFLSKVDIFTKDGKEYLNQEIEVNKPFKTGDWTIYQYGYDNEAGKLSSYTSLELVYDPWLTYAYIWIGLLFVSSIALVIQGKLLIEKIFTWNNFIYLHTQPYYVGEYRSIDKLRKLGN